MLSADPVLSANPFLLQKSLSESKKAKENEKNAGIKKLGFGNILKKPESLSEVELVSSKDISMLLDDVHSAGDALKNRPFPDEIKQYKAAVRGFMRFVLENAYSVEVKQGVANKYKPQFANRKGAVRENKLVFTNVEVIDRKLEGLANEIMSAQITQIKLLSRVEEINGLLINLLR